MNEPQIENDGVATIKFSGEITIQRETLKALLQEMQDEQAGKKPFADLGQFVDGPTLLKLLFPPECRPTKRWLHDQMDSKRIPFIKIGRLVFFDPEQVREKWNSKNEQNSLQRRF